MICFQTLIDPTNGKPLRESLKTEDVALLVEDGCYIFWIGCQQFTVTSRQVAALTKLLNSPQIMEAGHADYR
jgi:hypothetical protein